MGLFTNKKNDFFENMSLLCLVFNKYVFILFLYLFEMVLNFAILKMVVASRLKRGVGGRRDTNFSWVSRVD